MVETVLLYRAKFNAVATKPFCRWMLLNMALYMQQLVSETNIDLDLRKGGDNERNQHHGKVYGLRYSIYNKNRAEKRKIKKQKRNKSRLDPP